jgi:hypothetical protein
MWHGYQCPSCGDAVPLGIMSLAATCATCGTFYADIAEGRGWYRSRAAYYAGEAPMPPPTPVSPHPHLTPPDAPE